MRYLFITMMCLILLLVNSCHHVSEPDDSFVIDIIGKIDIDLDFALLKPDSTLWTWGTNTLGQLGNGTLFSNTTPTKNKILKEVVAIDLCEGIAIAVDKVGNVWYWGNRITHNSEIVITKPVIISKSNEVKQVDIFGEFVDLLHIDGTVSRLTMDFNNPTKILSPQKIESISDVIQISHGLALKSNGTLHALPGNIAAPEFGGITSNLDSIKYVEHILNRFTIVLKDDGTVWSWGYNYSGALGIGENENSNIPQKIEKLSNIVKISANGVRCMALDGNGQVWYWGLEYFDIDEGVKQFTNLPIQVNGLNEVNLICAGGGQEINLTYTHKGEIWGFKSLDKIPFKIY